MKSKKTPFFYGILLSGLLSNAAFGDHSLQISSGEYQNAVVELYTSEGCSSCPSADHWLAEAGKISPEEIQIIPLAFHVDYWNYLGWEDPYSSAENTLRQRRLGESNQQSTIYTPEFFVNGLETRGAGRTLSQIKKSNLKKAAVEIQMHVTKTSDKKLSAQLNWKNIKSEPIDNATLYLALTESNIIRQIKAGENNGKTLHHDHVVLQWLGPIEGSENPQQLVEVNIDLPDNVKPKNLQLSAVLLNSIEHRAIQAVSTPIAQLYH